MRVPCRLNLGTIWVDGIIRNVSTRGIMVSTEHSVKRGAYIEIRRGTLKAIDAEKGTIDLKVDEKTLAERKKAWVPRKNDYQSGALWRYAQNVGPAVDGAVTHPGAKAETHVYANI